MPSRRHLSDGATAEAIDGEQKPWQATTTAYHACVKSGTQEPSTLASGYKDTSIVRLYDLRRR